MNDVTAEVRNNEHADTTVSPPLWLTLLLAASAGGLGWGIRGQYGHETGAMIPGVLVALSLVFLYCPRATSLQAARAVALTATAFSFGGSMTYGQTVGLTFDSEILGNWDAFWWGMLGLFLKGGIWIGFGGAFLGLALGGRRYRPLEFLSLLFGLVGLLFLGVYFFNRPFDPVDRVLPTLYFSDHWHWEPNKPDLRPRPERWGGLALALVGLIIYLWIKKDRLGRNMAFCGILSGGFGFTIGQLVQTCERWNADMFTGPFAVVYNAGASVVGCFNDLTGGYLNKLNWWNTMETVFGLVLGFGLGLGLWLNRRNVNANDSDPPVEFTPAQEVVLAIVHAAGLCVWNFMSVRHFDALADHALTMGFIPIVAILGGRYWPYLLSLPLLAIPIAGKTLRMMSLETDQINMVPGWLFLIDLPMVVTLCSALYFAHHSRLGQSGRTFTRWTLVLATWLYFSLNFVFFGFPWPWEGISGRASNNLIYIVCTVILTVTALTYRRRSSAVPSSVR